MSDNLSSVRKKIIICYITLNRPEKRNAISFQMLEDIDRLIDAIAMDAEIRVVIPPQQHIAARAGFPFFDLQDHQCIICK